MLTRLRSLVQNRLTVVGVVVFVASIWAVAFTVADHQERRLKDLLAAQQYSAVSYVAKDIDNKLRLRLESVAAMAHIVPLDRLADHDKLMAFLAERIVVYKLFERGLVIVKPDGSGIFAEYPRQSAKAAVRYADLDAFKRVVADGVPVVGKPMPGSDRNSPLLHFGAPIRSADGRLAAVLIGVTTLTAPHFLDEVTGHRLGVGGDVLVAAPGHGFFVTATDPAFAFKPLPQPGANTMNDRAAAGFEGSDITVSSVGVEELSSIVRVPAAGWFVVGRLPTSEAFAPIREQRWLVFASSAVLSLLAAAIASFLVHRSTAALRASETFLRQSQRIARVGHYNYDIVSGTWTSSDVLDEIFGIDAGYRRDLAGWLALVHPDQRDKMARYLGESVIGRRQPFDREYRILRPSDAAVLWLHGRGNLECDRDGNPLRMFGVIQDITERKRIGEAVRENEEKLRGLYELSPLGIALTDMDGGYIEFNEAFRRICGYSAEELTSLDYWTLTPKKYEAAEVRQIESIKRTGRYGPYEKEYRRKDGSLVPLRLNGVLVTGADGKSYIWSIVEDITEQKRIEAELRLLSEALRQSTEAVVLADPERRFRYVNTAFEGLFGYTLAEVQGRPLSLLLPEPAGEAAADDNALALSGFVGEKVRRAKNGEHITILLKVGPIRDAGGDVIGLVGTMTDMRAIKDAEAALQENLDFARQLIEAIPNPLFYKDTAGRYLGCNEAFEQFIGKRRDEIIGHTVFEVSPSAFATRYHAADMALMEQPGRQVYEAKVRAADGEERDVVFHKATFAGHGGSIGGLVGVILDITEMKRAGERLQLAASVFEHSQQGIAITDENVAIIDVNAAFTAITGYSRAEVLGRNPGFLKSGHQSPDFYAAMWQAIARDGHWQGELWNRRKDGGVYAQLLTISAVCDENGRVRHYVGVFSDITLLKEHQSRLEKIAHYDALTGIPNRVLLGDRMRQAIAQTARTGRLMAICYLDLDGFKPVNDNWGHEAGDALLVEMARRLGECLRGGDTVARLGGDEFVLLLLGLERIEEAEIALRRILDAIAQPFTVARNPVALSASIGVTLYPHDDGDSDTLLRHADQAMYIAKQEGKNRYHLFDPEHDRRTKAHLEAFARIEAALPNREFELYYQPKVNMREGSVVGAEALIRWRHPERGLLSPAEFLPVVENTDVIVRIGDWVIDAALAQMEQWREQGVDLTVSVNIAARHLAREDFIARLAGHFAAHPQVPPSRLELEVLETAAIEDVAHVSAVIDAARDMGVSFALDDFGTGYSSLTYFKRLPASTLKIDQSFVRDMLHDAEDMAIVEGVISLTEVFRRNVIAEGVETIEHGVMLLNLGCELAQGYGIARPMPAAELPVWMRNWRPAPEWAATAGFRWPRDDLPLVIAEYDHRRWVENLAAWVEGGHEAAEPPPLDPAACRFGRWYAGAGRNRYGTLDAFAQIGPIHESIHAIGKRLAELVAAGRGEEARAGVAELLGRRDAMIAALQGLLADGILRR